MMTVEEARKILGDAAEQLSDTQIEELITTLSLMANDALRVASDGTIKKIAQQDSTNLDSNS